MKKGFTLIELLFVMAIISIIAGIGITQMSGSTETAENTAAKAELRNAITEAQVYYTDQTIANGSGTYVGWTASSSKVTTNAGAAGYCIEATGAGTTTFKFDSTTDTEISEGSCTGGSSAPIVAG